MKIYSDRPVVPAVKLLALVALLAAGSLAITSALAEPVQSTVAVGGNPAGVAFSPDGQRAYVTRNDNNSIAVVDVATRELIRTISGQVPSHGHDGCPDNFCRGIGATGIVVGADERHAYVSSMSPNAMAIVDLSNDSVGTVVKTGRFPQKIALSPDGARAYVLNVVANSISVVDLGSGRAVGRALALAGGDASGWPFGRPASLALSADGGRLFVTNGINSSIDIFNTATLRQEGTIGGVQAYDIVVQSGTGHLLALFGDGIAAYDPRTLHPVQAARYCRGVTAYRMALSPDGRSLAISLPEEARLVVADVATGRLEAAYETGQWPTDLAYSADDKRLAVISHGEPASVSFFERGYAGQLTSYLASHGELFCMPQDGQGVQ